MGSAIKMRRADTDSALAASHDHGRLLEDLAGLDVDAVADTLHAGAAGAAALTDAPPLGASRATVLPRRRPSALAEWHIEQKPRFESLALLGRGAMGEVALAKDNDIQRTVAVKRLMAGSRGGDAMLRFADEIRAVGQLEHPGIVPVYDVGVDDDGQHYLVMKHVRGDTLEAVIEKLRSGDPDYMARFTFEHRAHVFLEILQAIRYAHDRGIIHRDIKPANIMIGPFGEVTVMDWGLAKKVDRHGTAAPSSDAAPGLASSAARLLETAHGALIGTPLYMSPEQAAGKNDSVDERSDIFSLSLLFYEMLTLAHPLAKLTSLEEVLGTLVTKDLDLSFLAPAAFSSGTPVDYFRFLIKGLARKPGDRFQSVEEMETQLRAILSGRIPIECHVTLTKNVVHRFLHWLDRNPMLYTFILLGLAIALIGGLVFLASRIV